MSPEAFHLRSKNQKALAALSRCGRQMIAPQSGHFPQFAEPELVVQVIRQVVEDVRAER